MNKRITIVEDEEAIRQNYVDALTKQGYDVASYASRTEAEHSFTQPLPDLVLLDIGLDDEIEGGFDLCRLLRQQSSTLPIIFLTARDSDLDIVSGLRLGADDYLTKDISLVHLCARVAAFFRRMDALQQPSAEESELRRGELLLDMNRYSVSWHGKPLEISLTEFWLIHCLAKHPGHVKNREQLMQDAHIVVDDTTITSHIKRVRKKFIAIDNGFSAIDSVYGMGYRWLETKSS
ncbi:MAG: proteobacterial dedicated sortase system response regulator [Thiotrichaceae bacterium]|nr:proteobacterial dedicated sortase system response regulator [Thiotrichaceae bacterium]